MKILSITSGKGGVGKTTIALNIARQLSLGGLRTLIIDFDIHNKGTTCLFMDKISKSSAQSITGLIATCGNWDLDLSRIIGEQFALVDLEYDGKLFLLPAARPDEMVRWEVFIRENAHIVGFFKAFIQSIAKAHKIDVVLIDCYGGVDTLTIAAAGIADDLIIVNEPDVITVAGTLLLYKQLETTYASSERLPRVHFVINRISARHSFHFLQQEYQQHLSQLAVDRAILAYLPFDKLVFDTFGNYPFFSELLPNGLYAKKIRELIARLWPEPEFAHLTVTSERKRERIYQATAENPFADPERIFKAWKTAPAWALLPITTMIMLRIGPKHTISFFTLRTTFYICLILMAALVLVAVLFEPLQVSRWLLRKSKYERHRNALLLGRTMKNRVRAVWDYVMSCAPAAIGVLCFSTILFGAYSLNLLYPFRNLTIWHKQIDGFTPNGDYRKLRLASHTAIKPSANLSNTRLEDASLPAVIVAKVDLSSAHLQRVDLGEAKLVGNALDKADLTDSKLSNTDIGASSAREADFSRAQAIEASFWASNLSGTRFQDSILYLADFRQATLAKADFSGAIIKDTLFDGADLTGADFSKADFRYIDVDRRAELFSQLKYQGATLSPDQLGAAEDWEHKHGFNQSGELLSHLLRQGANLSKSQVATVKAWENRYGEHRWCLHWNKSEPAHLHDIIEPRIDILTLSLRMAALRLASKEDRTTQEAILDEDLADLLKRRNDFATQSDLIELLLIRGNDEDLRIARDVLSFSYEPTANDENNKRNQGVMLVLRVLLTIITNDKTEGELVKAWVNWLRTVKDGRLVGWSWNTWANNFPARRYSWEQNMKLRAVQLSAEGYISAEDMTRWFGPEANPTSIVLHAAK